VNIEELYLNALLSQASYATLDKTTDAGKIGSMGSYMVTPLISSNKIPLMLFSAFFI